MIGHLQKMHEKYQDKGLVLLGLDCGDTKADAINFLREHRVTFPNIIDSSNEARKVVFVQYQTVGMAAIPLEYIIDRDGKVVAAWYGSGGNRGEQTINRLGIK